MGWGQGCPDPTDQEELTFGLGPGVFWTYRPGGIDVWVGARGVLILQTRRD